MNKREFSKRLQLINPHGFKNTVCQQTFNALPKIYSSVKVKIQQNKVTFYQHLKKRSLDRVKSNSKPSNHNKQHSTSAKKKEKNSSNQKTLTQPKVSNSRVKIASDAGSAQFSDKFNKLKRPKKDHIQPRKRLLTVGDTQAKHKVKFNTLHFLPGLKHSQLHTAHPETLSEVMDQKNIKSVNVNPLLHLYKSKSPMNFSKYAKQILEESDEDNSRKGTRAERYTLKQPTRRLKYRSQFTDSKNGLQKASRFRTEPAQSDHQSFPVSIKTYDGMTEFGKHLMNETSHRYQDNSMRRSGTKFYIPVREQYKDFMKNYASNNPNFSFMRLIEKDTFQIIAYSNAVYFGEYSNIKQGMGVLVCQNYIFEGYFDQDQKKKGTQTTYDGIFVGTFKDGVRQGKGRFQWNNGQVYEGDWHLGKKHGKGIWKSPKGDSYEGQWVNGRQHGTGIHKHKNSTYKGGFLGCLKHGYGEQTFKNGDRYKGMYQKGRPHGKGRYDWNDGSYYQGQFFEGYRQGKGEFKQKNGTFYKGTCVAKLVKVPSREISNTGLVSKLKRQAKSSQDILKKASECTIVHLNLDTHSFCYFNDEDIEIKLGRDQRRGNV